MTNHVKQLQITDIQSYISLQNQVIEDTKLSCGQYAMKQRDALQLENHIQSGMPIVGIFNDEGVLMAATLVTYPDNNAAQHTNNYPLKEPLSDVFIIHGLCVSPLFQKQGLSQELITQAFNSASVGGRYIGYAKYASTRQSPQKVFDNAGFQITKFELDQGQRYNVTYVRKVEKLTIKRSAQMPLDLPDGSQFRYA